MSISGPGIGWGYSYSHFGSLFQHRFHNIVFQIFRHQVWIAVIVIIHLLA